MKNSSSKSCLVLTTKNLDTSSYCDNTTSQNLSEKTDALIRKLNDFQKRALQKNEIKAKAHRRFIVGFREVKNHLIIKKLKLVIIATDCEKCDIEGKIIFIYFLNILREIHFQEE